MDAIGFGLGFLSDFIPPQFDAVYKFNLNEFRGNITYQMLLSDLKSSVG